jgi:Protein of unknown function, DUF481
MRLERITGPRMSLILLSLAAFSACPAWARAKTDVIVMKNGDRITGEIKRLENAILTVDLDWVDGSISVNWFKVARLESQALFIVKLEDGTVYSARVITPEGPAPANLEIQQEGAETLSVAKTQVAAMTQTSEGILPRFSGKITLGATYSKGNNTTQYNIGSEVDYTEPRWAGKLDYTGNLSSSTGASASTRNQLDLGAYHFLRKNYFYGGAVGFLQSSTQGIQRQASVGGGVGRFLKNTNRIRFSLLGGIGWQSTDYVPTTVAEDAAQKITVGLITSNLQVFTFKKTTLDVSGTLAPAINAQGRLFSKVNATYYLKVFGKVDWNFSFYGNWDTQPPPHLASSDYGSSTGLSYSFGNK